jgi:DNA-binding XRE family transcriptional regulator
VSLGELERLTGPERLLVERRRRGETQAEAAERHGVSQTRYSRWERGLEADGALPTVRVGGLRPHERCLLYRRRAGRSQWQVARDLQRCKMWVRQMERGEVDCSELIGYWEA